MNAAKQMTIENTQDVAPVAETQNTASVPTEQPEIVEPGSTDSEAQEGDESEAKPEKSAEQKELERLRRQLTKRDRTQGKMHQELQATRQQLEQYSRQSPEGQQEQRPVDPHSLAREIAAVERFTDRSNAIAKDGQKRFSDFNDSLGKVIEEVGELVNERGLPTNVGEAILESDDAAALIEFLGKNPDLAADLEGLSPTKLGRQIERIEAQMKTTQPKPVSKASEPISPIKGGKGNLVKSLENMSMDEYVAFRSKGPNKARWAR